MSSQVETLEFQVEARQLLQLMIHSVYSNKDIFLRELISNASDALDKLRLEGFRDKDLEVDTSDLHIEIEIDKQARTLAVRDNGIGMSHDEVVQLIGTIAKSGTAEFLRKLKESADAAAAQELIGQFGVGFYSSFMVADRVTLLTRRAGRTEGTRWESTGADTYTIETVGDAPQGTTVTLHLKPEDTEDQLFDYASEAKVREIVKRYSDFITWPIRMPVEPLSSEEGDAGSDPAAETLNSMQALWARPREEVSDEDYHEFYKHISHDWSDPLETIRMQAEGTFEYQALLFIPTVAPLDLYAPGRPRGVQLYVKRVFIMDNCDALMPEYLRFVKGVVDAQDLSLNVSREALQHDRQIQLMRRRLVKRVLSTLAEMKSGNPERYTTFWRVFGQVLKEGLLDDVDNREAILDVCSFASTHDPEQPAVTLRAYVDRMKDGQQHIYYLTGESRSIVESSPHLEAFRDKGFEVLLLTDPIDEMWVSAVMEFDGKPLQSIAKGQAELDTDEEREQQAELRERQQQDFAGLLTWLTGTLQEHVKEVRLSTRLTTSPACIVGDTYDMTPNLANMYRAMGHGVPHAKRILELNPTHPLVTGLQEAHRNRGDGDTTLAETAELLHGMAVLAEGGELSDPPRYAKLLATHLERTL